MSKQSKARQTNARLAQNLWGKLQQTALLSLQELHDRYAFSVVSGDLLLIDGKWYVTHAGLLRLATRNRCSAIRVQPVRQFCDPAAGRWVFRATVYKTPRSKGFVGYGPPAAAAAGMFFTTGYRGQGPNEIGISYPDPNAGIFGAFAIMAALT